MGTVNIVSLWHIEDKGRRFVTKICDRIFSRCATVPQSFRRDSQER
jgi:hypothetical protein